MAAFNREQAQAGFSALSQRTQRAGTQHYWQTRITATLDRLEREARRMFQLERELSEFSNHYYQAVGDAAQRLARLEALGTEMKQEDVANVLPAALVERETAPERSRELKLRYRNLAKEVHPDRAMLVESTGNAANIMHSLNAAYQQGDLAVMLRLEAQMLIMRLLPENGSMTTEVECALRDVERAGETYADSYRAMLGSPLNELMLRAMSARLAGWDWMEAVVRKVERAIEEKERVMAEASIAQISAWRDSVTNAA